MAIDVKSLSITKLFNSIKNYFKSQENNTKWKDFNTGAEGNFLMRMFSTFLAVLSHRIVVGRRENFHDTANYLSSQIALAVNNGYSVCRGYNMKRVVTIVSDVDRLIPKLSVVGFYDTDHSIITMEPLTLQAGKEYTFEVCVGVLKEITWRANTSKPRKFVRFEQRISEDIVLYLDGEEVPHSKIKKDNLNDMYYIYTNPYKSVSIEYLNTAENSTHKYSEESTFKLRYIELDDVESKSFSPEMFNIGMLTNTLTTKNFVPFEDVDSIRIASPLYRETQNLVRSKEDYPDMINAVIPSIHQIDFEPITSSYISITYLKDDFTLLDDYEYQRAEETLRPAMGLGRAFPDVTDPERETITFDIQLKITDRYIEEADIRADVNNIINSLYRDKLKQKIDLDELENELNQLTYVKTSRPSFHTETRAPYQLKRRGDMIKEVTTYTDVENGTSVEESKTYRCTAILGKTGMVEPDWKIPNEAISVEKIFTGLETEDGELVWACYKRLPSMTKITAWKKESLYAIGDFVYAESIPNFMFKCVDIIGYTGDVEPDVTEKEVKDYLEDGTLLCICIPYSQFYIQRSSNTRFRMRDRFTISNKSFEVIGHLGRTGGTETLIFTDAEHALFPIPEGARKTIAPGNLFIEGDLTEYIAPGDLMRVSLVNEKQIPYVEVDASELEMQSYINAKVKPYEDTKQEEEEDEPTTPTEERVINIDMSIPTGYSGATEPDFTGLSLNDWVEDGDLSAKIIEYDASYEMRANETLYRIGEKVNVGETSIEYVASSYNDTNNTPSMSTTVNTIGGTSTTRVQAEKVDPNANWKELEEYLEKQKQIHRWIISEAPDALRTPNDVLNFYATLGDGSRFTKQEINKLKDYYVEYNPEDEEQIYLHMEQFGSTRLEAIAELREAEQLGEPIADATCLRYYRIPDEEKGIERELVYIDWYTSLVDNYTIRRTNTKRELRATRQYYTDGTLLEEHLETIGSPYVNMFIAQVKDCSFSSYSLPGVVKELTCIVPEAPIGYYNDGSFINLAFTVTNDGRVRWEEVDDLTKYTCDWNVYANFNANIELKY